MDTAPVHRSPAPVWRCLYLLTAGLLVCSCSPSDDAGSGTSSEPAMEAAEQPSTSPPMRVAELGEPVGETPFGVPLDPQPWNDETRAAMEAADEALAADPDNVDLIVDAAQARAAAWRYNEAIELFTRGLELDPGDWRLYRHRGHRFISTRRFDWAIADLERAVALDPYGFNSAYHLGLAYFLAGRFADAAAEYGRCYALASDPDALALQEAGEVPGDERTCMEVAEDDDARVALAEWYYRALRRSGDDETAAGVLADIAEGMNVEDNTSYYDTLLFYKGLRTEDELLDPDQLEGNQLPTMGFGVAHWHLVEGETDRAMALMERIVHGAETPTIHWNAFGYIAAETELLRAQGQE